MHRSSPFFLSSWTGFWNLDPVNLGVEFHDPGNVYIVVGLTVAMLIGLWQALRNAREGAVPFLLVLMIYPLVFYITHPGIRYRHLMDPEMIILAASGVRFLALDLRKSFPSLEMWFRRPE